MYIPNFAADTYQSQSTATNQQFNSIGIGIAPDGVAGNIILSGMIKFGGSTNSFPALKRNGAALRAQFADDSGATDFSANNITAASGAAIGWLSRSLIQSAVDGNIALFNNAGTGFTSLQFGGVSASFPALKRNGTTLQVRLADDSGDANLTASNITINANVAYIWSGRSQMQSPADGNILLYNNAGSSFGLLQFGGTTSAFPAIKRNGATLQVKLADDSALADIGAANVSASASASFFWIGRSLIQSPADGNVLLLNQAATSFGLLLFGGTTSAFPAIKRNATGLRLRLADDSADTGMIVSTLGTNGSVNETQVAISYSASMTPNAGNGNSQVITITNGTAFTINAPTNTVTGQYIEFTLRNTSGGAAGVATWNAVFKMTAWNQPANGNSRSIRFRYDGTNWVEILRSAADVPN